MKSRLLLTVLILFCATGLRAQDGPGGVGTSANNIQWLRADKIASNPADGTTITQWDDQSGNNWHATIGAGINEPTFESGILNGKPILRFDGTQDYMDFDANVETQLSGNNYSIFSVGAKRTLNAYDLFIGGSSNGTNQSLLFGIGNSTTRFWLGQVNNNLWGALISGESGTDINTFGLFSGFLDNAVGHKIYQNGSLLNSNTNLTQLSGFPNPYLARYRATYYEVDIAEMIIYNSSVNTAQRKIIDNYLAAKYGITIANDYFAYEASHPNELAGIGRDDALNLHNDAKGSGIARVDNPSDLGDGEYFLFGHDNQSIASWSTSDCPTTDIRRLIREWRISHVGNVGTVDFTFYTTQVGSVLPALAPAAYTKYVVLVDADGDFTSGASVYEAVDVGGGNYKASGLTIPDGYFMTFGEIIPKIQFRLAASSGLESVLTPNLDIDLNYIAGSSVDVDYTTASGTATEGAACSDDFNDLTATATILSGTSSISVALDICDDANPESDEAFTITLSGPTGGVNLGTNTINTYTILANDMGRLIEFQGISSSGNESFTPITINVEVDVIDAAPTTVDYIVTGSATAGGVDYTLASGTLTIPAGQSLANPPISIVINNDVINENTETVVITLLNPSGTDVCLGSDIEYTYSIIDDDSQPTLQFQLSSDASSEDAGTVNINVQLSAVSGRDVSVDYLVSGTAIGGGADYTALSSGTLVIPAGNLSKNISALIIDDSNIEVDESIILSLSNPSGASLGTNDVHTSMINDNDFFGWTGPGGVGDAVTNSMWLRADKGTSTTTDGNTFDQWDDQSGNTNSSFQTTANNMPTFKTNVLNAKPVVRFDGTNDFMNIDPVLSGGDGLDELLNTSYTVMLVGARRRNVVNYFFGGSSTNNNEQLMMGWNNLTPLRFQLNQYGNAVTVTGPATTSLDQYALFGGLYNSTLGHYLYENGTQMASNTNTVGLNAYPDPYLGRRQGTYYEVDIAEMLIYNQDLSSCQRIIVENYLGAKYGLSVANTRYVYASQHPNDVAGIGRVSAFDMHTAAKGSGILKIGNASALDNGDYFLFGHNGGSIASFTTTEAPTDVERVTREWRADQTGDVGTVSVSLYNDQIDDDFIAFDPSLIPVIMIDADGDFSSGASLIEMIDMGDWGDGLGNFYQAYNVTIPDGYYFTFGQVDPKIQFTLSSSGGQEDEATVDIEVSLNYSPYINVDVDYAVSGGDAVGAGTDYTLASGTLTIVSGTNSNTFSISVVDDPDVENTETIDIELTNPSWPAMLGLNTVHTYSIFDNDLAKKVQFATITNTADEAFTPLTVTVELVGGTGNPTTVDFVASGTATNGVDYTIVTASPLSIGAGLTTATITININDDAIYENAETIILTLSNPSIDANLGTDLVYTYNLLDNDLSPTVQFTYSESSGSEGTTYPTFQITQSAASGSATTVNYTVTGTASNGGIDYTLSDGIATISAGSTTVTVNPVVSDDALIENPETIIITLIGVTGATLGTNVIYTYTILDNEFWGYTGPGGVGDANFNTLWLKADDGTSTTSDGAFMDTWSDKSGNGNDYSNAGGTSDDPLYVVNGLNSRPIIRFDGGSDYLEETDGVSDILGGSYAIFAVAARRLADGAAKVILGGSSTTDHLLFYWLDITGTNFRLRQNVAGAATNLDVTVSNVASEFSILSGFSSTVNGKSIYGNGTLLGSNIAQTNQLTTYPNPYIARYTTTYYPIDVAEIIQFNTDLGTTKRNIVDNYLAAKYNTTISNDKYAYQANHGSEVAGLGKESSIDLHTTTQGSGIVRISDADNLDNSEYLFFGHDGSSIASWTTTEAPSDVERLAREWRVDHDGGNVGTISLSLETSSLLAPSGGYTKRVVLVDADGDFTSGAIIYEMEVADGTYYKATGVDVPDGYYITFGNLIPKVQFVSATSSDFENVSNPTIQLYLNYIPCTSVTVDYSAADGTAFGGGVDYTLALGTATIVYGTTTALISPTIFNDVVVESSENFTITLNSASGGVQIGTTNIHTYTINDDDSPRQIYFAITGASGDESFSTINVTVQINLVDATNPTAVDYTVTGTASGIGVDYTLASGTAQVDATFTTTSLTITVNNDLLDEGDETVIITLSNPTNSILGANQVYTYTIVDNDSEPTVEFSLATSLGSEGATPASVVVSLSAISGQDVTVNYDVNVGSTATGSGTDYSLANGILTIPAGSLTANISIGITDDALVETTETIVIDLSSPSGAGLDAITQHTFSIIDNDDIGFVGPGGVGNSNNLSIWYLPELEAYGNGANVTSLTDYSGNANDATAPGGNEPVFQTNIVNSLPIVRFTQANSDYLNYNYGAGTSVDNSSYSIYSVAQRNTNVNGDVLPIFGGPNNNANEYVYLAWVDRSGDNPDIRFSQNGAGVCSGNWDHVNGTFNIISGTFDVIGGRNFYNNSATVVTNANTVVIGSVPNPPCIGRQNANYADFDAAELFQYHIKLNDAQRIIVDNYLSSKYAIAVGGNDRFAIADETTYRHQVIGIGREDASNFHTAAQGRGIVKIWNSNSLDNADYLLLGHDNAVMAWTATGAPASTELCGRVWRFDETGDIGEITISVDNATIDALGGLGAYSGYALILSTDNDFSTTGDQTLFELNTNGSYYEALNATIGGDKYMTVVRCNKTVEFSLASSSGGENMSPASITVELNFVPQTDITVSYTVADVTATGGGIDYTLANGTVVINAYNTTATIEPSILYDVINPEADEDFTITLTGADNGVVVGTTDEHTFTITNVANNLTVDFQQVTSSGDESFTSINLVVTLNGVYTSDIDIDYAVTGGTAVDPDDYGLVAGTVTILAGNLTVNIPISIVDDAVDESNETIDVTISNPEAPSILGTQLIHTYTITDNDPSPTIQFTSASGSGTEAVPNPAIEISMSAATGQDITVDYTVTGGTATGGGSDYTLANGTATIVAGATTVDILPIIVYTATTELSETIIITLSNPIGATLGANSTFVFTIIDIDDFGITGPGGVGDANNNKIWYKADNGPSSTVDGSLVSQWSDVSGNTIHATQATTTNQPTYIQNGVGGKPVLRFDGTSDYFFYSPTFVELANYTIVSVAARRSSSVFNTILGSSSNTASRYLRFGWTSDNRFNFQTDNNVVNALITQTGLNVFNVYSGVFNNAVGTGKNVYENNTIPTSGTNTLAINTVSPSFNGTPYIGNWRGTYAAVDIAEIVMYNTNLNTAQLKIVNSYLAAKYSLTISNDKFTYDATHRNDVAGIGRDNISNYHTAARGPGIIKISSPNSLDDGDYMLWGHDNGSIASWVSTDVPTDVQRLSREWRFDQTGNVGTLTFTVYDLAGAIAVPVGTKPIVMVDSDGDFTAGAILYELSDIGGDDYEATSVTIADGYYVAVGCITPKVQFTLTTSSGNEPTSSPNLQITLNYIPNAAITVNYSVSNITATGGGVDYTLASPGTVIISAGAQTANITPTIVNDVFAEANETFSVTLTGATAPVIIGTNAMNTFTIVDDDNARIIQFSSTSSTADESLSPSLTIQIDNIDAVNPTTVNYTITGTANGSDYTIIDGIATIIAGNNNTTISLGILDDAVYEVNETVIITLSSPTNAGLGTNYIYTYTIIDNDTPPTIAFTISTSNGSEETTPVLLEISLSAVSGAETSVFYTVSGGTATGGGTDYTLANGTATVTAGALTGTISILITNDLTIETDETIIITLSAPSGATLGVITVHTFTIIDDDNIGITGPGGVGDQNYNNLWLCDPVAGSITTWSDISGNGNNAVQATVANKPTLNAGTVASNNKPFLYFDNSVGGTASDDYMTYSYAVGTDIAATPHTVFAVGARVTNVANYILGGTATNYWDLRLGWSNTEITSPNILFDQTIAATRAQGQSTKVTGTFSVLTGRASSTTGKSLLEDGYTRGTVANNTLLTQTTTPYIARYGGTYYRVNVAEIIQYKTALNTAQRRIVENYLGAKFALTNSNDLFAYDATFGNEVIGIGRENSTNFHNAAQGRGIVKISTASSFGDGDYLLMGHDNGDLTTWTATDAPTGSQTMRMARAWRFDETNEIGTITVEVDASTLPAIPAGNIMLLVVDSDNDGVFATGRTIYPMENVSGSLWDADNVDITNDNRFCIAYGRNISQQTGNFNDPATWLLSSVPGTGEPAVIDIPHVVTLTAHQTVGSVDILAGGELALGTFTLSLDNGTISNAGTFTPNTGTVRYAEAGAQQIADVQYYNLTTAGTGTKTLNNHLDIDGNLTIGLGTTIDVATFDINIGGNWSNSGSFVESSRTVTFDGGLGQTISNPETFNNLTINKSGGDISLSQSIVVNGQMDFSAGDIVLGSWNITTGNSASIINGSGTSYIQADGNGKLVRNFSATPTTLFYPLGDVDEYSPMTITMNSGTLVSSNISVNLRDVVHPNLLPTGAFITRYWTVTPSGITTPNYDIALTYLDADISGTEADIYPAKYSSSAWSRGTIAAVVATNILNWTGVTSFSDHTGGSLSALPIELIAFNVKEFEKFVNVSWITATEINNDYFTIERTSDFENIQEIAEVDGAGNSNVFLEYRYIDEEPLTGISYYRLKQTDFDGKSTYSDWVSVLLGIDGRMEFKVYPNPVLKNQPLFVQFNGLEEHEEVLVVVRDILGNAKYSKVFVTEETEDYVFAIDQLNNLSSGVYIIIGTSKNEMYYKKIVIK
ncbi:MAG: hypothetical protein A2W98_01280 [Bacteroidetes bacterium GWF2_33_38]|nr:MAG: hypothetical protein A2W98_01280 [Bacteroidetes bacterium GWF2_33_38]OFY76321.1 MAG: hypothetical protein A2265_11800 [Bacteroidetes bacterium RIFOXYA12_FULL_33_9]